MKKSNEEGTFAIIVALIVLFSAMLDPIVSVVISVAAMVLYAIWKFSQKK